MSLAQRRRRCSFLISFYSFASSLFVVFRQSPTSSTTNELWLHEWIHSAKWLASLCEWTIASTVELTKVVALVSLIATIEATDHKSSREAKQRCERTQKNCALIIRWHQSNWRPHRIEFNKNCRKRGRIENEWVRVISAIQISRLDSQSNRRTTERAHREHAASERTKEEKKNTFRQWIITTRKPEMKNIATFDGMAATKMAKWTNSSIISNKSFASFEWHRAVSCVFLSSKCIPFVHRTNQSF